MAQCGICEQREGVREAGVYMDGEKKTVPVCAHCVYEAMRKNFYSIGFGAGIPALAYVINMLANVGGDAEAAKYFTFFTLFDPSGIAAGESAAWAGAAVLLAAGAVLYALAVGIFARKDLSI